MYIFLFFKKIKVRFFGKPKFQDPYTEHRVKEPNFQKFNSI